MSIWRLVVVVCAFTGFGAAVSDFGFDSAIPGLSQQASLLTGLCYLGLLFYPLFTGGRRHEPASSWTRGALAVLLLLVCVTFLTLMNGELDSTWSLFEHLITPLVVLVDWLAVGRNQATAKAWYPLTWVAFPFAYLAYFMTADVDLYGGFLDPESDGFATMVLGFLAGVVVVGYGLFGLAKIKSAAGSQPNAGNAPGPYPPQQPYAAPSQQYPPQQPYAAPQPPPQPPHGWNPPPPPQGRG